MRDEGEESDVLAGLSEGDAALVSALDPSAWEANGVPGPERAARMVRATEAAREALSALSLDPEVRTSPLGAGWSRDVDVHVKAMPREAELLRRGWAPLDGLLHRVGSRGAGRWAVVENGVALGCVDLSKDPKPDPVRQILDRCRGRGEVRLREVVELRALARAGAVLPGSSIVRTAARIEAGLGGDQLAGFVDGSPLPAPTPLPRSWRALAGRLRGAMRPKLVVALSGVDGAGKSTLARALAADLDALALPVSLVWTRPGMGMGMRPFERAASLLKRRLHQGSTPGVRRVAEGESLPWRRGVVGWAWALLITMSFLADVRRQHARGRGILVYDRHLTDALVTLDFVYGGANLSLHRALIRAVLPRASLTVYLDVPVATAVSRKPADTFGELAVRRQLEGYRAMLPGVERVVALDATRPLRDLVGEVLDLLLRG